MRHVWSCDTDIPSTVAKVTQTYAVITNDHVRFNITTISLYMIISASTWLQYHNNDHVAFNVTILHAWVTFLRSKRRNITVHCPAFHYYDHPLIRVYFHHNLSNHEVITLGWTRTPLHIVIIRINNIGVKFG